MKPHMILVALVLLLVGYAVAKHTAISLPLIG